MHDKGKSIVLKDGLRLYKQVRSRYWWVCVREAGEELRKSTKCIDESSAREVAYELAAEVRVKIKLGLSIKGLPNFSELADEVIHQLKNTQFGKENDKAVIAALNNYLIPYFKSTSINKVDNPAIYQFYQWREEKTGKEISPTQRSNTDSAIRRVFDLALNLGHIKQSAIPALPKPPVRKKQARNYFPEKELKKVFSLKNLEGFIQASRNYKTSTYRKVFQYYIAFIFFTGARPGEEVTQLKYGDLRFVLHKNKSRCLARITKGKTTSYTDGREILVDHLAKGAVDQVFRISPQHNFYRKLERVIEKRPEDRIFAAYFSDGSTKVPNFDKVMQQYMVYLNMDGKGHVLYSFRHSYITYSLLRDVSAYDIAKQCGTSEAMIDQYYDHVKPLMRAEKLSFPELVDGVQLDEWLMGNSSI